jgi:hypothetical protein
VLHITDLYNVVGFWFWECIIRLYAIQETDGSLVFPPASCFPLPFKLCFGESKEEETGTEEYAPPRHP